MRVLFVIPNVISFQSFLGGLAAQMIAAGDEVHLACNSDALWGNDLAVPDQAGVRQHRIEFPRGMNPLQHFKAARQLRRLVAAERFDERKVFEKVKTEYARLLRARGRSLPSRSPAGTEHPQPCSA